MPEERTSDNALLRAPHNLVPATALDAQKALAINELLSTPATVLAVEAGKPILPFEIGIVEQFLARLKPDVPKVRLRRAIGAYAHMKSYFLAAAQPDAMRYDIHGVARCPVSEEDRLHAAQGVERFPAKPLSMSQPRQNGETEQGA